MQAAGEVTELLERAGQPVTYLVHIGADVARRPVADTAQQERKGHQVLLDAVVEIPFDPAAHLVADGEDPAAGGGQLSRELLDLPLPFGQLLGVPFGLFPQFPFACRLLPVQPADPGAERRDRRDQRDRGHYALGAADGELVVRHRKEVVEGQRGARRRHQAKQKLSPGHGGRRDRQQDQGDQHVAHVVAQREQRERQQHRHDQGHGKPDPLPEPGFHHNIMPSCLHGVPWFAPSC